MRCYRRLLNISYRRHIANEEVHGKIRLSLSPSECHRRCLSSIWSSISTYMHLIPCAGFFPTFNQFFFFFFCSCFSSARASAIGICRLLIFLLPILTFLLPHHQSNFKKNMLYRIINRHKPFEKHVKEGAARRHSCLTSTVVLSYSSVLLFS